MEIDLNKLVDFDNLDQYREDLRERCLEYLLNGTTKQLSKETNVGLGTVGKIIKDANVNLSFKTILRLYSFFKRSKVA